MHFSFLPELISAWGEKSIVEPVADFFSFFFFTYYFSMSDSFEIYIIVFYIFVAIILLTFLDILYISNLSKKIQE